MSTLDITPAVISTRFVKVCQDQIQTKAIKTKREFCLAIDMPPQNYHPIELGIRCASINNLCSLINTYKVNPTWLFLGSGDMYL